MSGKLAGYRNGPGGGQGCTRFPRTLQRDAQGIFENGSMNDRQLNYFMIVAEEKSLSRAAARLPLSISALSRQIQALEEELNAELFSRSVSGFKLTSAGEALLRHARTLSTQFALIRKDVRQAGDALSGRLDVGGFGTVVLTYLPQILSVFSHAYPDIEVGLHTAPVPEQIEYVRQGRTLLFFDRPFPPPPDLASEIAFHDTLVVAMPEDHPLAQLTVVPFEELRDQPIIGRHQPDLNPPEFQALSEYYGFSLRVVCKVQDMFAAAVMAGSGAGLALVPASLQKVPIPKVVLRPLAAKRQIPCELYCFYRKNEKAPILHAMLQIVRQYHLENREPAAFSLHG